MTVLQRCTAALIAATALARPALAQDTTRVAPATSSVSVLAGIPAYDGQTFGQLATLGLAFTSLNPGHIGGEFSIGTSPRALSNQLFVVGARLDLVVPIAVTRDVFLIPGAGLSGLGVSAGGVGGNYGVNAMLGAIVFDGSVGFRANVTANGFRGDDLATWLMEAGVVWRW